MSDKYLYSTTVTQELRNLVSKNASESAEWKTRRSAEVVERLLLLGSCPFGRRHEWQRTILTVSSRI